MDIRKERHKVGKPSAEENGRIKKIQKTDNHIQGVE